MTAHNAGAFLKEAVDSIISQSLVNWRMVLIDNGSDDNSTRFLDGSDSRIKLFILPENIGRAAALRFGLGLIDTPFTAVLDADDIALPNRFARQLSVLQQEPGVVLTGTHVELITNRLDLTHPSNQISGRITHDQLGERNVLVHSSLMYRTDIAKGAGGYRFQYQYAQDFDLILRMASIGECFMIPETLTKLRIHADSISNRADSRLNRLSDESHLFRMAPDLLRLTLRGKELNRRRQALVNLERCFYELRRGQLLAFFRLIFSTLRVDPRLTWITYLLRGRPSPADQ